MKEKPYPPLVSVIIPAYNFGRFLLRALKSVRDQTYSNFEICLTNDGSTDRTDEVVKSFIRNNPQIPFTYIVQDNRGLSAARNAAAARARGEYLCFLDADDALKPDCLKILVEYKRRYPDAEIISGGCECVVFDREENIVSRILIAKKKVEFIPSQRVFIRLFYQNMMGMISILITRKLFERTKGFDENIRTSEDRDFFLRAARAQAAVLLIPEIVGVVYKYSSGLSRQPGHVFKSVRRTFRKNRSYLFSHYPEEGREVFRRAMALRHLLVFGLYRSSSDRLRFFKMLGHLVAILVTMPSLLFSRMVRRRVTGEHSNFTDVNKRKDNARRQD